MIPAPSRELVLRWMDGCGGSDVVDIVHQVAVKASAWGWIQQETDKTAKICNRPDCLKVGDIWEFETEVKERGRMKLKTMQWRVVQWHAGEMAWQLQSLDGKYFEYLLTYAPQYEAMKFIGTGEHT
jgi:hypothetical protein